MFPLMTDAHVDQKSNPTKTAKQLPVQTPVNGNGTATKMKIESNFFQYSGVKILVLFSLSSISPAWLFNRFSIKFASLLKNFTFFSNFIIGINNSASSGTIKQLPNRLQPNACQFVSATLFQKPWLVAKGIAPRNSITGTIEIKIVAKTTLSPKIFAKVWLINSVIAHPFYFMFIILNFEHFKSNLHITVCSFYL